MAIGKVVGINRQREFFVAQLTDGSCSVVEILGYNDIEIGTQLKGELDDEGSCEIVNLDTQTTIDVVIQYAGCRYDYAMKKLN